MSIVDRIIARAKRTPYAHLAGYMNRWWLVPYVTAGSASADGCGFVGWRRPIAALLQKLGVAVRIHEILRSDEGRDPHDHPWSYCTVILRGGYWEFRYDGTGRRVSERWHGPGSILFRRASDLHKLVLPLNHPLTSQFGHKVVTTLFITGREAQQWGFLTRAGKVPFNEYLAAKRDYQGRQTGVVQGEKA